MKYFWSIIVALLIGYILGTHQNETADYPPGDHN